MKKIIIVFLCCVLMEGCNTVPPTTENTTATTFETIVTEDPIDRTKTPVLVEPTEKEKESAPADSDPTEPKISL